MRNTLIATGMIAVAATSVAGPANAKPVHVPITVPAIADVQQVHHKHRHHVLPRHVIVRSLYKRGYRKVHNVYFSKGYWRARALGRRGVVALTIHPRNAHIVHRRVVHARHYPRRHHGGSGLSFTFRF